MKEEKRVFDIEYKGGNTIVLSGKKTTIITDPKLSLIGLKPVALNLLPRIASLLRQMAQSS